MMTYMLQCLTADEDIVETDKVKVTMQFVPMSGICTRAGQVLAAGITSTAGEVCVKLGCTESIRYASTAVTWPSLSRKNCGA